MTRDAASWDDLCRAPDPAVLAYQRGSRKLTARNQQLEAENARLKAELLRAALYITQLEKRIPRDERTTEVDESVRFSRQPCMASVLVGLVHMWLGLHDRRTCRRHRAMDHGRAVALRAVAARCAATRLRPLGLNARSQRVVSPAHALRVAGATEAQVEAFYTEARDADEDRMRHMLDNPTAWLKEQT